MISVQTTYSATCDKCQAPLAENCATAQDCMLGTLDRGKWVFDANWGRNILVCMTCNARNVCAAPGAEGKL